MKPAWSRLISLQVLLALTGCARWPAAPIDYVAVVERVDDLPGNHYTPTKGQEPLTCVHLHVLTAGEPGHGTEVRLMVLGQYQAEQFGAKGDRVSFRLAKPPSLSGDIWMEELVSYRVTSH